MYMYRTFITEKGQSRKKISPIPGLDIKPFFDYELTAIPSALFKDSFMRKPMKSQLAQFLTLMCNLQINLVSKLCK